MLPTYIQKYLQAWHPIRLGVALNYSVFICEILTKNDEACAFAKAAHDFATYEIKRLNASSAHAVHQNCNLLLQMLQDNIMLWQHQDSRYDSRLCQHYS